MKIALVGYGKMGQLIHRLAGDKGHQIVSKINSKNAHDINSLTSEDVDVAIEFSHPAIATKNFDILLQRNIPIVTGTTGWHDEFDQVSQKVKDNNGTLFYASNFSLGVNLFFSVNSFLASLLNKYDSFKPSIEEIHHLEKKDAPSGTAISIANQMLEQIDRKNEWILGDSKTKNQLSIEAKREAGVFGTHIIKYESDIDQIELKHLAKNRNGFATGAILAAEWIQNKKGIFTMTDMLKIDIS